MQDLLYPNSLSCLISTGPLYDPVTSTLHFVDISQKKVERKPHCLLSTCSHLVYVGFPCKYIESRSFKRTIRGIDIMLGFATQGCRSLYSPIIQRIFFQFHTVILCCGPRICAPGRKRHYNLSQKAFAVTGHTFHPFQ